MLDAHANGQLEFSIAYITLITYDVINPEVKRKSHERLR